MEVPRESFHKSSWDSRTCYPRRAFNRGFTGNFLIHTSSFSYGFFLLFLPVNGCIRDLLSFLPSYVITSLSVPSFLPLGPTFLHLSPSDLKFTPSLGPSLFHSLSLGPKVLTVYLPKQLFYYCTTFGQR